MPVPVLAHRRTLVAVVVGAVLTATAVVLALRGGDRDVVVTSTATATAAPTPSPSPSAVGFADYVAPDVPAVGPEALSKTGPGWAITQVSTNDDDPVDVDVLYLTSPDGDARILDLPDGLVVERLVDWLPGTTLAVVAELRTGEGPYEEIHHVVDLATGAVRSSHSSLRMLYIDTRFVADGTSDVLTAIGPRAVADKDRVENVVSRSTADGETLATSPRFALDSEEIYLGSGGKLSVSDDGAYVLTDAGDDSRLLDARTLQPVPFTLPSAPDKCIRFAWLTAHTISTTCGFIEDRSWVRDEVWLVHVGGSAPALLLGSDATDRRGDIRRLYRVGDATLIDADPYFGAGDGLPGGLHRVGPDEDVQRVPGQDGGPADWRRRVVHGVAGSRLLAVASEEKGSRSLLLLDPVTGETQTVVPDLAVGGMRVVALVAGS